METGFMNRIIGLVLALVVGGLLVGGLLIPSIEGMTATEKTFENEGSFFMNPDGETHTYTFGVDNLTFDGVTVDYPVGFGTGNNRNATLFIGEDWMCRMDAGMIRFILSGPNNTYQPVGSVNEKTITATVNGSDFTMTVAEDSSTFTRTDLTYMIADKGDYVLCYNPYILANSPLIGGVRNNVSGVDTFEIVKGNTIDGFEAIQCRCYDFDSTSSTTVTSDTYTINTTPVNGVNDLLKLDSIVQSLDFANGKSGTMTLTYLIAPATYTVELSQHLDATQIVLFGVVSLLGIIMLVVVAANAIRNKY